MNKVLILTIIIIIVIVSTITGYYIYTKKAKEKSATPSETYSKVKHPESCDTVACNSFIHDNVVVRDSKFTTDENGPCKGCHPHFSYAWLPDHGLSFNRGAGWVPCGSKDECYQKLKT
jgi:hypothetical protein